MSKPAKRSHATSALLMPWAITKEGLRAVVAEWTRVYGERDSDEVVSAIVGAPDALQARMGEYVDGTMGVTVRDGVAIVPICGPLCRWSWWGPSYSSLRADLQKVIDDSRVRAIVLDVNSPGGEVDGVGELADAIYAMRGRKPLIAYVGGMCASAAYWLASQCDTIVCATTAFLGSIGVRSMLIDDTQLLQSIGIREIDIISSRAPNKRDRPIDAEIVAKAQAEVDYLETIFMATVARGRGVSADEVAADFGGGGCFIGAQAVAAKLADRIGALEDLIAELSGATRTATQTPTQGQGANAMAKPAKNPKSATTASITAPTASEPPKAGKRADEKDGDGSAAEMDDSDRVTLEDAIDDLEDIVDGDDDEEAEGDDTEMASEDDEDEKDDKKDATRGGGSLVAKAARRLGLPASADVREVLLAAASGAVAPAASVADLVAKGVEQRFAAEDKKRKAKARARRAEAFADNVVRGAAALGMEVDRDAIVDFAKFNYASATKSFEKHLKAAAALEQRVFHADRGAGGDRTSRGEAAVTADSKITRHGRVRVERAGLTFSAAAKALMAKDPKLTMEQAQREVLKSNPGAYRAYLESR